MQSARPYRAKLHPGARSQAPEGEPNKAHSSNVCVCVSPVFLTGGYRLWGAINGDRMSWLLDTGAAVTLLREDTWARIYLRRESAGAEAVDDAEVGQRRRDATAHSW